MNKEIKAIVDLLCATDKLSQQLGENIAANSSIKLSILASHCSVRVIEAIERACAENIKVKKLPFDLEIFAIRSPEGHNPFWICCPSWCTTYLFDSTHLIKNNSDAFAYVNKYLKKRVKEIIKEREAS